VRPVEERTPVGHGLLIDVIRQKHGLRGKNPQSDEFFLVVVELLPYFLANWFSLPIPKPSPRAQIIPSGTWTVVVGIVPDLVPSISSGSFMGFDQPRRKENAST
jgi:hypothetical protein